MPYPSSFGKNWEGPIKLTFSVCKDWKWLVSLKFIDQTKTVRYHVKKDYFDWYVPYFMLSKITLDGNIPTTLTIEIAKSYHRRETIGFIPKAIPLQISHEYCEYSLDSKMGGYIRYRVDYNNRPYKLHVPKDIFSNETPPHVLEIRLLSATYNSSVI